MHHCKTCNRDWPENYCPECHCTIDKGSEWFDAHAQMGQKKEIVPNLPVKDDKNDSESAKGKISQLSQEEMQEALKNLNEFADQLADSEKATVTGSLLQIGLGLFLIVAGIGITWMTYTAASGGGTYFIFWGLAIYGMVVVFKGFGKLFVASWKIGVFAAIIFLALALVGLWFSNL